MKKFLVDPFDEAERQVLQQGKWMVATVEPRIGWPTKRQAVTFGNREFLLLPQGSDATYMTAIALRADRYGLSSEDARKEIMRFCSALSWQQEGGLSVIAWGGGNLPRPVGVSMGRAITDFLPADRLPVAKTDQERAGLALYREGISLDNPFYAFLSLYKVISVLFPNGKERGTWIADTLDRLDSRRAEERRDQLRAESRDVGLYLRDECRHAVAHAESTPYVNPDEIDDHFRFTQDLPLLRNLAELAIEERTEIRRPQTEWNEHLYELAGFKELFPADVVSTLAKSEGLPDGTTVELPDRYTIVARRGPEAVALSDMEPEIIGQVAGGLVMDFVNKDATIQIRTEIAFSDERLRFDPLQGIGFTPDRSNSQRIEHEIDVLKFSRCILSNGHIEVWD